MVKKIEILVVIAIIIAVGTFFAGYTVGAGTNEPGSIGDPLITKSYLEKRLTEMTGISSGGGTAANGQSAGYISVTVAAGKNISLKAGAEMVLYRGNATFGSGSQLINLASSNLFEGGNSVVIYNSFLAVKDSTLQANGECVVFIRGSYTIK